MIEVISGDIWNLYNKSDNWICCTVNGSINSKGECVMGRGIALEVKKRFPEFAKWLGDNIKAHGNISFPCVSERIITFPVKHIWDQDADLDLILFSMGQVFSIWKHMNLGKCKLYIPLPGCGNGRLDWDGFVRPALEKLVNYTDNNIFFVRK